MLLGGLLVQAEVLRRIVCFSLQALVFFPQNIKVRYQVGHFRLLVANGRAGLLHGWGLQLRLTLVFQLKHFFQTEKKTPSHFVSQPLFFPLQKQVNFDVSEVGVSHCSPHARDQFSARISEELFGPVIQLSLPLIDEFGKGTENSSKRDSCDRQLFLRHLLPSFRMKSQFLQTNFESSLLHRL